MRFDHVGIKARDVEQAKEFYTKILGFQVLDQQKLFGKTYYFVGNETLTIEIEPAEKNAEPPDWAKASGLYHLALNVDDIDKVAEELKRKGVEFIIEPFKIRPDRKMAYFDDPDGTRIQLIQDL